MKTDFLTSLAVMLTFSALTGLALAEWVLYSRVSWGIVVGALVALGCFAYLHPAGRQL